MDIFRHRQPATGGVTAVAGLGGVEMPTGYAGGAAAVMAAVTGTDHVRMVDADDGHPGRIAVAVLALVVGLDMA